MKKLALLLVALIMVITQPLKSAGQGASTDTIDMDRMNRDIRIMEGVLTQMFQSINEEQDFEALDVVGRQLTPSIFNSEKVKGTYLPGYGIVFTIPDLFGGSVKYNIQYARWAIGATSDIPEEERREMNDETEAAIQELITDFFVDYAPAVNQLSPDDKILIVYGKSLDGSDDLNGVTFFRAAGQSTGGAGRIVSHLTSKVISMSVTRRDLDRFRRGQIDRSEFEERIETGIANQGDDQNHRDLDLFANILKTALEADGAYPVSMNETPTWFHLDNFGAMFQGELNVARYFLTSGVVGSGHIQIHRPTEFSSFFIPDSVQGVIQSSTPYTAVQSDSGTTIYGFNQSPDSSLSVIGVGTTSIRDGSIQSALARSINNLNSRIVQSYNVERTRSDSVMQARNMEIRELIENRIELIKELIVDYGQTLSSIESDQSLLLVLNVKNPEEETIHIRTRKSDLEAVGRGAITRQQALDRISVTRQ